MDHELRRAHLAERLPDLSLDAVLVTSTANVRYLTGFTGSSGQALIGASGGVFLTDGRYAEQARHEIPDMDLVICPDGFAPPLREACAALGVGRLGLEADHVTYRAWHQLREELQGVELAPLDGEVERLRSIKDAEELHLIELAQAATDRAFEEILDRLAVGMSERAAALEVEVAMRRAGADGVAFEPIVAFGEHAAEPHHRPTHRTLEEGDVVKLDVGARWAGYHADMTRTIAFGEPPGELRKIHDLVRQAQQAGIDAVRAGAAAADVDRAARAVIEDAGYGERFDHGLGHGVGLEIHERPRLGRTSEDVLPAGAVVTVEPGVYLPGLGGVRIEDMVEVESEGCRVLPTSTRQLIEL